MGTPSPYVFRNFILMYIPLCAIQMMHAVNFEKVIFMVANFSKKNMGDGLTVLTGLNLI